MSKFLFMQAVLESLSQDRVFRKVFATALRILAILTIVISLVVFINNWRLASDMPAVAILGLVIFQLLFVVAIYMVVHVLLIRAKDIDDLLPADYVVIPAAATFLKAIGEIFASYSESHCIPTGESHAESQ